MFSLPIILSCFFRYLKSRGLNKELTPQTWKKTAYRDEKISYDEILHPHINFLAIYTQKC
jgi:hypothetical protein